MDHNESRAAQAALAAMESARREDNDEEMGDYAHLAPHVIYRNDFNGPVVEVKALVVRGEPGMDQPEEFKRLIKAGWICLSIQTERHAASVYVWEHRTIAYMARPVAE